MNTIAKLIFALISTFIIYFSFANASEVNASYAVIDAETGRLLFGHHPHEQKPIASLTKIWTALVTIENSQLDEVVTVSKQAAYSEGSSIYLQPGEQVKVETLLYGLMLRSGNDAAYALAEHTGSSIEGFVDLMNEKALYYGLKNTKFMNPSGLHHDEHLSSAYDTALMLKIAMENKDFYKIASTVYYKNPEKKGITWQNKHRLLREGKNAVAGKTGYTKVAGRTLATYFEQNGKKIIVVTLNESNDWKVHKALANEIFSKYDVVTIAKKGNYKVLDDTTIQLKEPIKVLLNDEEQENLKNVLHLSRKQQQFGIWHVFLNNEVIYSTRVSLKK